MFELAGANDTGLISRENIHQALEDEEAMAVFEKKPYKQRPSRRSVRRNVHDDEVRPSHITSTQSFVQEFERKNGNSKRDIAEQIRVMNDHESLTSSDNENSVASKIISVLQGTPAISARDLKEALKTVASQNGANVDSLTSNAFVNKVFFEADSGRSGQISRAQLREFIGQNPVETAHVAKESNSAHSDPVTLSLLQILEQSESGVFDKKQVTAAVK